MTYTHPPRLVARKMGATGDVLPYGGATPRRSVYRTPVEVSSNLNDREPMNDVNPSRMYRHKRRNISQTPYGEKRTSPRQVSCGRHRLTTERRDFTGDADTWPTMSPGILERRFPNDVRNFDPSACCSGDRSKDDYSVSAGPWRPPCRRPGRAGPRTTASPLDADAGSQVARRLPAPSAERRETCVGRGTPEWFPARRPARRPVRECGTGFTERHEP